MATTKLKCLWYLKIQNFFPLENTTKITQKIPDLKKFKDFIS